MIYFDSAATTFQKPRSVAAAMEDALATMSSPGRGGYRAAMRAADTAFACRDGAGGAVPPGKPGAGGVHHERHPRPEHRHQEPWCPRRDGR